MVYTLLMYTRIGFCGIVTGHDRKRAVVWTNPYISLRFQEYYARLNTLFIVFRFGD